MSALNSSCGSPCDFQIRTCLSDLSGTPPRVLFAGEGESADLYSSPTKVRRMNDGDRSPISGPPEAPRKHLKKKLSGPIKGLPVLPDDFKIQINGELGRGSFGKVKSVHLEENPSVSSPVFAMKVIEIIPGGRVSPTDARKEAENYGSRGCIPGFGMSSSDGKTYFGFSPIVEPLDKTLVTINNIKLITDMARTAIMAAKISMVFDVSTENMGIIRAGTPTPILGGDGLPCAGPIVEKEEVLLLDPGNNDGPNDCNGKYGALFDEGVMDSEDEQLKYRRFKCDVMSALLRNRIVSEPRNEYDIVREICKSEAYGYTYAAGDRR